MSFSLLLLFMAGAAIAQSAETFIPAGNITTHRQFHTAKLLTNGKVLISGGNSNVDGGCFCGPLSSAELYDPSPAAFTATGPRTTLCPPHGYAAY